MENIFIVLKQSVPLSALHYKRRGRTIELVSKPERFDSSLYGGLFKSLVDYSSALKEKKGLFKSSNPLKIKAILFFKNDNKKIIQLFEKDNYLFALISNSVKNLEDGFGKRKVKTKGRTVDINKLFGLKGSTPRENVKKSLPELWESLGGFKGEISDTKITKTIVPMTIEFLKHLEEDEKGYHNILKDLNKKLKKELSLEKKNIKLLNYIIIHNLHKIFTNSDSEKNLENLKEVLKDPRYKEFLPYVNIKYIEKFKEKLIDILDIDKEKFELLIGLITSIISLKEELSNLGEEWIKDSHVSIYFKDEKLLSIS